MAKYKKKLEEDIRCPLEYGLTIFGGKWKSRIICVLSARGKLRYSEIRKEMYNITDAVLASTLKDLIEDGIIDRKSYDEIPPKVEYSLTEKGRSVVPILQSICQWSDIFYKEDSENEMVRSRFVIPPSSIDIWQSSVTIAKVGRHRECALQGISYKMIFCFAGCEKNYDVLNFKVIKSILSMKWRILICVI